MLQKPTPKSSVNERVLAVKHPSRQTMWRLGLMAALLLIVLMFTLLTAGSHAVHAADATATPGADAATVAPAATPAPAAPAADPGGLATGSGADLMGIAPNNYAPVTPGASSADVLKANGAAYTTAQKNEPFAVGLADMVRQNQLGINFVWTLVAGFLGHAHAVGLCNGRDRLHPLQERLSCYGYEL